MNPVIRQRHLAHAITLTHQVRKILIETNEPFTVPPPPARTWTDTEAAIDVTEVLLANLQLLHDHCAKLATS